MDTFAGIVTNLFQPSVIHSLQISAALPRPLPHPRHHQPQPYQTCHVSTAPQNLERLVSFLSHILGMGKPTPHAQQTTQTGHGAQQKWMQRAIISWELMPGGIAQKAAPLTKGTQLRGKDLLANYKLQGKAFRRAVTSTIIKHIRISFSLEIVTQLGWLSSKLGQCCWVLSQSFK